MLLLQSIQNPDYWLFWCPGCDTEHIFNKSWTWNHDLYRPTITPSILNRKTTNNTKSDQVCHIIITDGQIYYLADCTHKFVGKVVPMENISEHINLETYSF